jgi:ABC-type Fe3+/spermidine/putrescine transport system ATPase subunit
MSFLELNNIEIEYDKGAPILKDFDLAAEKGEFLSLLGPSGCGKTTTLRTIAGFIEPFKGRVRIGDKDYTRTPPHKRNIGLVFQSYALFPHLSVFENVAFGLRMRHAKRDMIKSQVAKALAMVDLAGLESRLPSQLSGGQRQRVALARAVVIEPDLLLLDEPLSNLDAKLRVGMRAELHRLQRQLGITAIYVTHDQIEALSLSDRIVVMNKGRIEQIGKPEEIYYRPATPFVARFMDSITNLAHALRVSATDGSRLKRAVCIWSRRRPVGRERWRPGRCALPSWRRRVCKRHWREYDSW